MSDSTPIRIASPEHLAKIETAAMPIVEFIQSMPGSRGMEVLLYVIVRCMLDVKPADGFTPMTAFDQYAKVARTTIEKNYEAYLLAETHGEARQQ